VVLITVLGSVYVSLHVLWILGAEYACLPFRFYGWSMLGSLWTASAVWLLLVVGYHAPSRE